MKIFFICMMCSLSLFASPSPPDEEKIFFHLHQTIRWAELYHLKKCPLSKGSMEKHLAKIKYSQPRLVDSKLYKYYISTRDLWQNLEKSKIIKIETLRAKMHEEAEKQKIKHPEGWQTEFVLCS